MEAIARATKARVRIEGGELIVAGTRVVIEQTPRDEIRKLLGVKRSRTRRLTLDDLRQVATALPGVVERVVERRDGRSVVSFDVAKVMFVKLFEAGNLLPPDVDDVVLIRRVPDRAALLATTPERFFLTRHYGDPQAMGPVLTRLSENTKTDLDELTELIEESWALCAPRRLTVKRRR